MTDAEFKAWLKNFTETISSLFRGRIVCIGLQGSRERGEATDESDIDVVVILDAVSIEDLEKYDSAISRMKFSDKICGFISGREELEAWDKADLFQFYHDTRPIVGSIEFLKPLISDSDVRRAVLRGACDICHMCTHNFLHEKDADILAALYKASVFVIQAEYYCENGVYVRSRAELADRLEGDERNIMRNFISLKSSGKSVGHDFRTLSALLLSWSRKTIIKFERQ